LKLHVQVTKGNWDIWGRYTRGGQQFVWYPKVVARPPWGWVDIWPYMDWDTWPDVMLTSLPPLYAQGYGYQQATGYIGYKRELNERTNLDLAFSYDMFDFERFIQNAVNAAYREDEYYAKAMLRHDINKRHKIACGFEYSHQKLGLDSVVRPDLDTVNSRLNPMPRWSTDMYSILGEHQWTLSNQFTTFLGARLDKHTYTDWLFSPRASVIYTPSKKDTFKVMWARSVRANYEEEMKATDLSTGDLSDPEILDSLEIRYERQHSENLSLAASVFVHYNLELISWDQASATTGSLGTQKEWGVELEAMYHTDKTRLSISHGYTKLYDFDLEPNMTTFTTAKPYGYGDDLANWSNHITKIQGQYKIDDRWTLDGSLRIYWGFPGLKDLNQYSLDAVTDPVVESGWEKGYRGNYYLNLGLQYQPKENLTFRVDGFNLLGIFDKDLNKRNYYADPDYRSHAAAVGVSVIYKF